LKKASRNNIGVSRIKGGQISIPEPNKSPTLCQRLNHHCCNGSVVVGESSADEHSSILTPEVVLSEYNKDLIPMKHSNVLLYGFIFANMHA